MSESLVVRAMRLDLTGAEGAARPMEQADGFGVMREALREMDRAVDKVRAAQESATMRRLQAVRQQCMFRAQILAMGEKARCAIAGGSDDHARGCTVPPIRL